MKQKRFYLVLVIALAAMNIVLLALLWQPWRGLAGPKHGQGRHGQRMENVIGKALALDGRQKKAYRQMRSAHFEQIKKIKGEVAGLRRAMYGTLGTGEDAKADSLAHRIGLLEGEAERATYRHFKRMRAFCNPVQQAAFDTFIDRVVEHQNRRQRYSFRHGRKGGKGQ